MFTIASETSEITAETIQQKVWPMMSNLIHDLRQPLSVIDACADYLDLVLPEDDHRTRQQLELLQEQISEANRIMHEALLNLHYTDGATPPELASSRPLTKSASAAVTY